MKAGRVRTTTPMTSESDVRAVGGYLMFLRAEPFVPGAGSADTVTVGLCRCGRWRVEYDFAGARRTYLHNEIHSTNRQPDACLHRD
jgi:hypothetical protein